jgi:glycosyltransferase involved in cell wall biosynthesis
MRNRKQRITFLMVCYKVGGFETKLDTLLRNLNRKRFDLTVLLIYPHYKAKQLPENDRKRQRGFFSWPGVETVELIMKHRHDFLRIFRILAALKRLRPDALLFLALGPAPFIVPAVNRLVRVQRLIRVQDTVIDGMYPRLFGPLDRLMQRFTDHFITPSRFLKRMMVRRLKLRPSSITVIPNGINLSRFGRSSTEMASRSAVGIPLRGKVVGMVANLVEVKDHAVLLDAAPRILREIPGVRFLLIGDGPLRNALESKAKSLRIANHVLFLGYRSDVDRILPLLNVTVLCSRVEVHPISLIESMACGVPVVAPDVGGVSEIVRDRETGLLVRQGDPVALADAVLALLKNPALARRMGESGRRSALRRFSVETMAKSFESLLNPERPGQ